MLTCSPLPLPLQKEKVVLIKLLSHCVCGVHLPHASGKFPAHTSNLSSDPIFTQWGPNECPFGLHWVSIHQYTFLLLYGIVHQNDLFKSVSSIPFFCSLIECQISHTTNTNSIGWIPLTYDEAHRFVRHRWCSSCDGSSTPSFSFFWFYDITEKWN